MTNAESINDAGSIARARMMIVIAALLWSTSGFFAKAPWFDGWPGYAMAFWRALFACVILLPLVRRPQWSVRLIPVTAIFVAMNYTYLTVMERYEASSAIWLQYTAPIWVITLGVVLLKEKASKADWLMVAFQMVGVAVILAPELHMNSVGGLLLKLGVGVTYALVVLSLRWMKAYEAAWIVGINHVVTCLVFLPFVVQDGIGPTTAVQWVAVAAFGMLQMGLPYWLFARSVQHLSGHEATGIVIIEPLLLPMWVFLAWSHLSSYESPGMGTIIGAVFILIGLIVKVTQEWKPRTKAVTRG
jgi:DME family drug/metabolite transporter